MRKASFSMLTKGSNPNRNGCTGAFADNEDPHDSSFEPHLKDQPT
jgi:hypothetical protein